MKKSLWWGGLLVSAGMFLGSVVIPAVTGARAAQTRRQVPEVVKAQAFEVVDKKGETHALLALVGGEPSLVLGDEKGEAALLRKWGLVLWDEKSRPRARLGEPGLVLCDKKGETRAGLKLGADGNPGLLLYDEKGKTRSRLDLNPDGSPHLAFYDKAGKWRATLELDSDGGPGLWLADEKDKIRAMLKVDSERGPGLGLLDEKGKVLWKAPPKP